MNTYTVTSSSFLSVAAAVAAGAVRPITCHTVLHYICVHLTQSMPILMSLL